MNWTKRRKREVRRRRAAAAVAVSGCALLALAVAGLFLPAVQGVSGQRVLDRPPETIWRVLTDLDGMPFWRSDLTGLERLPNLDGRPAWRELGQGGDRVVELAAAEPPTRLVFRQTRDGIPALPRTTFELTRSGRQTLVTVTELARVRNPLRRVFNRLYPPRRTITRFLRDLDLRVSGGRRQVAIIPE